MLHGDHRHHRRAGQIEPERLPGPAVGGDHPADQHTGRQEREAVEPVHDVVAVRVGDDHQDQDRLVPDDAAEELLEIAGPRPAHLEQADEAGEEHHEVGEAQVGARPSDPLDQEGARKRQHRQQHRVRQQHAGYQHQRGEAQPDPDVPGHQGARHPRHHHGDRPSRPGRDGATDGRRNGPSARHPPGLVCGGQAHGAARSSRWDPGDGAAGPLLGSARLQRTFSPVRIGGSGRRCRASRRPPPGPVAAGHAASGPSRSRLARPISISRWEGAVTTVTTMPRCGRLARSASAELDDARGEERSQGSRNGDGATDLL